MNRTKGFVNLNRFKSGRAIKRLKNISNDGCRVRIGRKKAKGKK